MRNTLEYPVTFQECNDLLDEFIQSNRIRNEKEPRFGDMTGLILRRIKEYINTDDFDEWLRNYEDLEKYTR